MSERGVFAVDRGIWEHDLLTDSEPFSRREAWLWLLSEAAWKPHRRRIIGRTFELKRGQLVASTRFIASKWRWSEARVRRFLSSLISESMVGANSDAGVNVITICKYDDYQRVSLPGDATRESDGDAGATQERRKVEDKEDKESFSLSPDNNARARDDWPSAFEEVFWNAYPHKVGKGAALKALVAVRKRRLVTWAALMAGLHRYAAKTDDRAWCNPATWINQQRWSDQPGAAQMPRAGPQRARGFADLLANLPPTDQTNEPDRQEQPYDLDLTANR
jgi:hypothetical protein